MLYVIIGKTCSGKTAIVDKLVERGFKKVVTYTSRPKRKGEIDGKDYHFISKEEFLQKIDEFFFMEYKVYQTTSGEWYYGTSLDSLENTDDGDYIIILTPDGYNDLLLKSSSKHMSFYIYANNTTIKRRLEARKDMNDSPERRLEHDNKDFKGVENIVHKIVFNNDDEKIDDVVNKILEHMEK